jgi:hypothetical protein
MGQVRCGSNRHAETPAAWALATPRAGDATAPCYARTSGAFITASLRPSAEGSADHFELRPALSATDGGVTPP